MANSLTIAVHLDHPRNRLALWGIFGIAVAAFAYLLFGFGENPADRQIFPSNGNALLDIIPDEKGTLAFEEVIHLPDTRWTPVEKARLVPLGGGDKALWARVRVRNTGARPLHGVLSESEPYADRIAIYLREDPRTEEWTTLLSGEKTPAREKAFWGRKNAFPLVIPAGGEAAVYLRYEDYFGAWAELAWWPRQTAFHTAQLRGALSEGLYFGALCALVLYSAMLWVQLRQSSTGHYLLYLGSFIFVVAFARSVPQLFGWSLGSPWMEAFLMAGLSLSGFFLLTFAESFLELTLRMPRIMPWLRTLQAAMLVLTASALAAPLLGLRQGLAVTLFAGIFVHLNLLAIAISAWRRGAAQANYLILAFGVLLAGLLPAAAMWLKIIPLGHASRCIMAGSALEMLLLSVAITTRVAFLQQEKIAAQKKLLLEAERRETLQEAYADDLATEVRERTRELEVANADKDRILTILGHDLRSPLTGLTRAAEYWAPRAAENPGLSAFINEAARSGQSLLLMIEDLVIWARLRAGTRQMGECSLAALIAPVLVLHGNQAAERGINLEGRHHTESLVKTDIVPVQALLRNLLSNAIKAARTGVVIATIRHEDSVEIAIRDDGPGLDATVAEALSSGNPERLPTLHGLGLRLCMEISRLLDLKLRAARLPDGGTEFRFALDIPHSQL